MSTPETLDDETRAAAEALHQAVLDSALDCIVTIDHHGLILEFNPAAERTFGLAEEEVVGQSLGDVIVPPHLREAHRSGFTRYLAEQTPRILNRRIEVEALRADGTVFPVELTITRIGLPGPPVFTGHIRDITDRKAAEEELRRSRARLVEAADAARRRLERDLHDGAQQRLVALGLDLQVLRETLRRDPERARDVLDDVITDLAEAIAELRDLARGIHPAILTERGLGAALAALVRRSPVPAVVLDVPAQRCPAPAEATAYFVVAEALTNAARYADASSVEVCARIEEGRLVVEVADDGRGGADASSGSGLRGIADRAAALDGTLSVRSPEGGGTRIVLRVPCGS